ncbi:MAG: prephenate dehydrogenase [Dehalococcoidaceae bacterium]|nr:prephenate dehydrogenase [Dehalococcoidaceae bacterium]
MKIAIIGGTSQMGRWFARFLREEGKEVTLIDKDPALVEQTSRELGCLPGENMASAQNSDAIIVSVSIDAFEEVIQKLAPFTRDSQNIFDITSVKVMPVEVMHRYIKRGIILGAHPVFGPGARNACGHNFVLTPTSREEEHLASHVETFLSGHGGCVRIMSPEEHDRLMAIILGLAHFISIVSANTLVDYGKLSEMAGVQGVTYRALLTLVESVLSESPELYASLQMNLPHLRQAQEIFIDNARLWTDIVNRNDRQAFISRMKQLRQTFEANNPDFGKSYDNLYRLSGR